MGGIITAIQIIVILIIYKAVLYQATQIKIIKIVIQIKNNFIKTQLIPIYKIVIKKIWLPRDKKIPIPCN
jgi:hypothetical protein